MKKINILTVLFAALISSFAVHPSVTQADTLLRMDSDQGDYIGQGRTHYYDLSGADFTIRHNYGDPNRGVEVLVENPLSLGDYWRLAFDAAGDVPLGDGIYEGAIRFPFNEVSNLPAPKNGLSVSGQGRGCNTLTGRFEVLDISLDNTGAVASFAATFEQHCEGLPPALRGTILFNYNPVVYITENFTGSISRKSPSVRFPFSINALAAISADIAFSDSRAVVECALLDPANVVLASAYGRRALHLAANPAATGTHALRCTRKRGATRITATVTHP